MPALDSVAAVDTIMKNTIRLEKILPNQTSFFVSEKLSSVTPLSTTEDCTYTCMYGEMVVPITATNVNRNACSNLNWGLTKPTATALQSGRERKAETT